MKHIYTYDSREIKTRIEAKRIAVRAVIQKDDLTLLIYLKKTDEYKFPGGGLEDLESYEEGMKREVLEEAGAKVVNTLNCIGYIDQIYPDKYVVGETFSMRSIYYQCDVIENVKALNLDDYEKELGIEPVWVTLDIAIEANEKRLLKGSEYHWTERELFMFKYLKKS